MSEIAYQLLHDIGRLSSMPSGDAFDLRAFDFPKASELWATHYDRLLELPETTFFYMYSNLKYITELDVLYPHSGKHIVSQRLIDVLLSVKKFNYRKYKIAILEEGATRFQNNPDGYKMPDPYSNPEEFKKKSLRDDMYIFQPLEILSDVFDWEKSIYQQSEVSKRANSPGHVREFVLKEPAGGFPPVFRLKESPTTLFISAEAREALKKAGIKGISYLPLKGAAIGRQDEIDVLIS
jgi:hypothetical protein